MIRRRLAFAVSVGVVLALVVVPTAYAKYRGTDTLSDLAPTGGWGSGGLLARYPLGYYQLDTHIDTGLTNGLGGTGTILGTLSTVLWDGTVWWVTLAIQLFTWAFSLDVLGGPHGGALGPVGQAVTGLYRTVGVAWTAAAIAGGAVWAVHRWLKGEHGELLAGTLITVLLAAGMLFLVTRPQDVLGRVSGWAMDGRLAVLAGATGSPDTSNARQATQDGFFRVLVLEPFAVLDFGGITRCVDEGHKDADGVPRDVPCWWRAAPAGSVPPHGAIVERSVLRQGADGHGGWLPRYMRWAPQSDQRNAEYEALKDGQAPLGDPQFAGYAVDKADEPSVDPQQEGGQGQRFILALIIAIGTLGASAMLAFCSGAVILSGLFALALFGLAPFAYLAAFWPGVGHDFVYAWAKRLVILTFIGVAYAAIITALLTVSKGLAATGDTIGWIPAFLLLAAFYWTAAWMVIKGKMFEWLGARDHHQRFSYPLWMLRHPFQSSVRSYGETRNRADRDVEERHEREVQESALAGAAAGHAMASARPDAQDASGHGGQPAPSGRSGDSSSPSETVGRDDSVEHPRSERAASEAPVATTGAEPSWWQQEQSSRGGPGGSVPASQDPVVGKPSWNHEPPPVPSSVMTHDSRDRRERSLETERLERDIGLGHDR